MSEEKRRKRKVGNFLEHSVVTRLRLRKILTKCVSEETLSLLKYSLIVGKLWILYSGEWEALQHDKTDYLWADRFIQATRGLGLPTATHGSKAVSCSWAWWIVENPAIRALTATRYNYTP